MCIIAYFLLHDASRINLISVRATQCKNDQDNFFYRSRCVFFQSIIAWEFHSCQQNDKTVNSKSTTPSTSDTVTSPSLLQSTQNYSKTNINLLLHVSKTWRRRFCLFTPEARIDFFFACNLGKYFCKKLEVKQQWTLPHQAWNCITQSLTFPFR